MTHTMELALIFYMFGAGAVCIAVAWDIIKDDL